MTTTAAYRAVKVGRPRHARRHRRSVRACSGAALSGSTGGRCAVHALAEAKWGYRRRVARIVLDARWRDQTGGVVDGRASPSRSKAAPTARTDASRIRGCDRIRRSDGARRARAYPEVSSRATGYSAGGGRDGARVSARRPRPRAAHQCESMRYRIAVLDAANGQGTDGVRAMRAQPIRVRGDLLPWVRVTEPSTRRAAAAAAGSSPACTSRRRRAGVHRRQRTRRSRRTAQVTSNDESGRVTRSGSRAALLAGRGYRVGRAPTAPIGVEGRQVRRYPPTSRVPRRGTHGWCSAERRINGATCRCRRGTPEANDSGASARQQARESYLSAADRSTMTQTIGTTDGWSSCRVATVNRRSS